MEPTNGTISTRNTKEREQFTSFTPFLFEAQQTMQSVHNTTTTVPVPPSRQTTYTTTVRQPISVALPTVTPAKPPPLIPSALPPARVRTPIAPAPAAQVITTVPADPLSPLYDVDGIRIHQKVEYIEAVTKYETQNQYEIYALSRIPHHRVHRGVTTQSTTATTMTTTTTSNRVATKDMHIRPGALLFKVREVSSVVGRMVAKSKRNAEFKLKNPVTGRVAMTLVRPYRVVGQYMAVYDGNGSYLGKIKKGFNPLVADLTVYDAYDNPLDRIRGAKLPWMVTNLSSSWELLIFF